MKSIIVKVILGLGLSLSAGAATYAGWQNPSLNHHSNPPSAPGNPRMAPEVDPGLAVSGLALLAGTLTVLRARRKA